MTDYIHLIEQLKNQTVLCVGDIILDEFVYGECNRISPESPTPVLLINRSEMMVGGAGNVARNLSSLGVKCIFVSVVCEDLNGQRLQKILDEDLLIQSHLVVVNNRPTTHKVRFVSDKYSTHLLRADWEVTAHIPRNIEDKIIDTVSTKMQAVGAVILSDYAKGLLTPRVIREIINCANQLNKPVIVDPSGNDYSVYQHADVITPNQQELSLAVRRPLISDEDIVEAAELMLNQFNNKAILTTRSEKGMTLVCPEYHKHVPARAVLVRDVSGAGDTVVALLGSFLAMGVDYETAIHLANTGASIVVTKNGTATLSADELGNALLPKTVFLENKIIVDLNAVKPFIDKLKQQGLKIGFTNGCFDLLHPGHIQLLNAARNTCDFLIVGLNSDASVTRLKGKERPIQNQISRAKVLSGLSAVDLVIIFEDDTPQKLIELISPSSLIKGADYTKESVVGGDFVEKNGGEIILVDLILNQSTTQLVGKLKNSSTTPLISS